MLADLLPMNEDMDVECRRDGTSRQVNVPHLLLWHSPDGFEWGYGGSGPAEFALNILYRFTCDREFSEQRHQEFKWEFVAKLPREGGTIPGDTIRKWIAERK